jgi:hypothetical protein
MVVVRWVKSAMMVTWLQTMGAAPPVPLRLSQAAAMGTSTRAKGAMMGITKMAMAALLIVQWRIPTN